MKRSQLPLLLGALLLVPAVALAHPHPDAHTHGGLGAGLLHPLLGLDHLLAMVGVGLWAAQQADRRALLAIPAVFLVVMLAGFGLGVGAAPLPFVELGIVGSVALVGALILFRYQLPPLVGAALAGLFAVFHGHAHGAEMAGGLSALSFGAGFVLASGALLLAGLAAWRFSERRMLQRPMARSAGAALLAASAVFLVPVV
ncbi:MAG: HupE/UreJ family protein [Ectothiorhodospiraceae bacterium]|nr:HupE/UreJ family protein [Ectothiorhodospiraceae bacterium]